MIRVLNLGAGVQSTTLLLMSCKGVLPKPDVAVFADTQWEPKRVYDHLEWLEGEAATHGIPVKRVTAGNIYEDAMRSKMRKGDGWGDNTWVSIPIRILNQDGSDIMVRRQCSREYKIDPIHRYIKHELLGLKPRQRAPRQVEIECWFGISHDEAGRAKTAVEPWLRHQYPFLNWPDEMLPRLFRRSDCINWLREHYPDVNAPKSACIGCPYHSNAEWREIKEVPGEWAQAVALDERMRDVDSQGGVGYLHRDCKPLDEVDLRTDSEKGQMVFGFENECEGMCGV